MFSHLRQQILMRANTDHTLSHRLRSSAPVTTAPDSPAGPSASEGVQNSVSDIPAKPLGKQTSSQLDVYVSKDKKKGSFLSRLSMIGSKRRDDDSKDSDSQISEQRADGRDAQVFSFSHAAGFIPRHKDPPRYIRVRTHNKKNREFNRMFLAQELVVTPPASSDSVATSAPETNVPITTAPLQRSGHKRGGAIWSMEFSQDGKYLASAGKDQVVRIWGVISTHEERRTHEDEEMGTGDGARERLSAPVFGTKPIREFKGHTGEVLDLSWSKNNFLLSSSMDKTVKLWHLSRKDCLCTFPHPDFVTSIAFHPTDDRFFLAGSLDSLLRLWSIPDKAVAFSARLQDLITAVAFSPGGKTAIAGVLNGLCYFFETEGLKPQTQIHVRSSRGKNAKGSKITGISTIVIPPPREPLLTADIIPEANPTARDVGAIKVLITSNDSRIRIYNLKDKTLEAKFKGHENTCSQISASFSDDAQFVICGSEDRRAFIWNTAPAENDNKRPDENFEAHNAIVTVALFAPTKARQLLGASGDPIYDLCNPPPVTLLSHEERASVSEDQHSEAGNIPTVKKPEESPAYIARSMHYDGNIIVTADHAGIIKVFRQDCAWSKRRHESWDAGSLSRRLGSGAAISRTGSIGTRTSGSHSRRTSLSQAHNVITPQGSSDRILSWRASVGDDGHSIGTPTTTATRSERSISPHKTGARTPLSSHVSNLAADARKAPYQGNPLLGHRDLQMPTSPTSSMRSMQSYTIGPANHKVVGILKKRESTDPCSQPPTPNFSITAPGEEADKQSVDKESDMSNDDSPGSPSSSSQQTAPSANTSFWGRWKGISSLALRPGISSFGMQSTSTAEGGLTGKSSKSEMAAMNPSSFVDDSHDEGDASQRRDSHSQATNDPGGVRRKSNAEALGAKSEAGEDKPGEMTPQPKEKRRKSVGFINIKPGRDSYEGSRDRDRDRDMDRDRDGSVNDRPQVHYPGTRRRTSASASNSSATARYSLPPGALRSSITPTQIGSNGNSQSQNSARSQGHSRSQTQSGRGHTRASSTSNHYSKVDESPTRRRGSVRIAAAQPRTSGVQRDNVQRDSVASTSALTTTTATSSEGEDMRCSTCGGKEFRVKHVKGTTKQRFLCGRCGTLGWEVGG
ncbi:hypothetical protein MKZ38_006744 [Zalerion maritima]|uniref:WD repeat-containing protein 44 n=1 Tax=Zalerion maritima TaxID=339359 RepID=A0AAD5RJ70_9PEZI|nr:hypothetical protein MKZ38_006744 [Zalerion maritima]